LTIGHVIAFHGISKEFITFSDSILKTENSAITPNYLQAHQFEMAEINAETRRQHLRNQLFRVLKLPRNSVQHA